MDDKQEKTLLINDSEPLKNIMNLLKSVRIVEKETGKILSFSKAKLEWTDENGDGITIEYPKKE